MSCCLFSDDPELRKITICIKDDRVIENYFVCPSATILCNKGNILIDRHTFNDVEENCTWPCETHPFNDTSEFPNMVDENCSFKQRCNLNGTFINGSVQTEWIAEVVYLCLFNGRCSIQSQMQRMDYFEYPDKETIVILCIPPLQRGC